MNVFVGTAGWSIPAATADEFPPAGAVLERYAQVFDCVEINSSFYRSHRPTTWSRWAALVPDHFRFAVKLPKAITHEAKLIGVDAALSAFADQIKPLGHKLGIVLVQLPPKLVFDRAQVSRFFKCLRAAISADFVCEPRNASWFTEEADQLLCELGIARAAADPVLGRSATTPGGWLELAYWRLHGSPVIYHSAYSDEVIKDYAHKVQTCGSASGRRWCIFDNTAASAATGNALFLQSLLSTASMCQA